MEQVFECGLCGCEVEIVIGCAVCGRQICLGCQVALPEDEAEERGDICEECF